MLLDWSNPGSRKSIWMSRRSGRWKPRQRREGGSPFVVVAMGVKFNRVAVVLKGYPRLSETFIAQEIRALEQRGLDILIVSLRHPTDRTTHPVHQLIRAPLLYLPEYLYHEPRRLWRGWLRSRRRSGYRRALRAWL